MQRRALSLSLILLSAVLMFCAEELHPVLSAEQAATGKAEARASAEARVSAALEPSERIRQRGAKIYADQCVACHGVHGQGNEDHYPDPLTGDATIGQLAAVISETMPEEDPDACVASDAEAVAAFIHHDFYSEAAQVRRRPPRATLARLTANQLRQSLADLYTTFVDDPWIEDERGLLAKYFDGKTWNTDKLKFERVDPVVDFDFQSKGPGEGVNASEFYIQWWGSLLAMETGRYEIVVQSTVAFKLDLGANNRMFIDNSIHRKAKKNSAKPFI